MNAKEMVRNCLHGKLWHCTSPDRFASILASGAILVNPDIPNSEKWKSAFVRKIGGVSLFDFGGFNPDAYEQAHPMCNWHDFVPYRERWGGAVWIEINRDAIADRFTTADDLVTKWKRSNCLSFKIVPRIEAAHIGDLPRSAFCSAFMTWSNGDEIREIGLNRPEPNCSGHFDKILAEWKRAKRS